MLSIINKIYKKKKIRNIVRTWWRENTIQLCQPAVALRVAAFGVTILIIIRNILLLCTRFESRGTALSRYLPRTLYRGYWAVAAAADIGRMSQHLHGDDKTFTGDDLSLYNILSSPRNAPIWDPADSPSMIIYIL